LTGEGFEMASSGNVLHFCVCQDHVLMVCNNTSCVSIACRKWGIDAGFVALEKFD